MGDKRRGAAWRSMAVLAVTSAVIAVPSGAQTAPSSAFTGTASARLVAVDVVVSPPVIFDPLIDGGQSVAQSRLDSLGSSEAYASSVFPGGAVIALPGLLGTLTEGEIGSEDIPPYPLYVSSSHPTKPSERQSAGFYDLAAESTPTHSRASTGDGATAARARVSLDAATGEVVSLSETTISEIRVSDDLSLVGIRSAAEVRQAPSGELRKSTSFEVAAVSILGQRIALDGDGAAVLGQQIPAAGLLSQLLPPILNALAEQGTTIELVPEEDFDGGVQSAGLRITTTGSPPPQLASGVESFATIVTFGRNVAAASNQAFAIPSAPAIDGPPPISQPPAAPPTAGITTVPAPATSANPASVPPLDDLAAPPTEADPLPASVDMVASVPPGPSVAGFYPVLILAGLALFGAARLFPHAQRRSS